MYKVLYHPRSIKFLTKLSKKEAERIQQKVKAFQENPNSSSLNIKRLVTTERSWRLRIGNLRVVYEVDSNSKTIYIYDIDYRGSIY